MEQTRVVVVAEHQYYGRRLRPGEEYDCETRVLPQFEQLGWVRRKDTAPAEPQYRTRALTAARRARSQRATA